MATVKTLGTLSPRQQQILEAARERTESGHSVDMTDLIAELGEVDSPEKRAAIRSTIFAMDKKGLWPFPIQRRAPRAAGGARAVRLDKPNPKKRGRPGRKPTTQPVQAIVFHEDDDLLSNTGRLVSTGRPNGETTTRRYTVQKDARLNQELGAMGAIWGILDRLSDQQRHRVLGWLAACAAEEKS